MAEGTIALTVFGLQVYWISQILKGVRIQGIFSQSDDSLSDTRKKLERILKK